MIRRRVTVVCDRHERPIPLGVLIPPARQPLTAEQFDAYTREWAGTVSNQHPEWPADVVSAVALHLTRKSELDQTQVWYEPGRDRLTKSDEWRRTERSGIVVDTYSNGRTFVFRCSRCKQTKQRSESHVVKILADITGDLLFADI